MEAKEYKCIEICSISMVRRLSAMLDLDTLTFSNGDVLPRGWHFFMLAGETLKSSLRPDGFPGLGVPLPDLGLPRLLLGGRKVSYNSDILIGAEVERTSFIKSISEKTPPSGRMAIVTIQHELRPTTASIPAIVEIQTFILLSAKNAEADLEKPMGAPIQAAYQKQVIPDETLLFQYSALGFNSHKIHLDRAYTQKVEGLPDLVVNGGLSSLLLTEFSRIELGLHLTGISVKHTAPLFCNRPLTLAADNAGDLWQLKIYDENNNLAVEMEARLD